MLNRNNEISAIAIMGAANSHNENFQFLPDII